MTQGEIHLNREAFSELGCMRSLVSEHVKMMALTATATTSTHTFVSHTWNGETIGSHTSSKQAEHQVQY